MIRLNDIRRTVIDEKEIKGYGAGTDNLGEKPREEINFVFHCGGINVQYDTKELRDEDVSLLDKFFEVQYIKEKLDIDKLKKEKPIFDINTYAPVKKDEQYLTWDYVKHNLSLIKVEMPNGATKMLHYNEKANAIFFKDIYTTNKQAIIYDEKLFNALKLKRVKDNG